MKAIQNIAAYLFIAAVAVLSIVSILGVWEVVEDDMIEKSFLTIGLLGVVAIVVIAAGRFIDTTPMDDMNSLAWVAAFKSIRHVTLGSLIVSAVLLAFLGVLAIWEVIADMEVLMRSMGTLAVIGFASLIIVMVCLERENRSAKPGEAVRMSAGTIVLGIIGAFILFAFLSAL
ncbi:MAG: hypothetical protein KBC38_02975 [Candidatus Pacebacteria bacterium]|nr:hypothetical protein [Candidatus Paceibacterota bacterium]MBP9840108.1 hypothetical protein [Candidatus Paceibacterota bacterium]